MKQVSEAIGHGGRLGKIQSVSGSYDHDVRIPGMKTNGVTPEEFLAGAWVACFGMTFMEAARSRDIDATDTQYKASVSLESSDDGYTITEASLKVDALGIDEAVQNELIEYTHTHCPVSKLLTAGIATLNVTTESLDTESALSKEEE